MADTNELSSASHTEGAVSRRTLVKAAAWSAPVVVAAIATPLATASVTPPDPTATIIATLGASTATGSRVITFSNGLVSFDPDGSGLSTGNITVTLPLFGDNPAFPLVVSDEAWAALGWSRISNTSTLARYRHSGISSGVVATGTASWTGAADTYVQIAVGLSVQTAGIGGVGLTYTFDPDE